MAKKNKVGHPVTVWTPEKLKEFEDLIIKYTDETTIPIMAEFAYLNNVLREELYGHPELSYAIKRLISKKEAALEKHGLIENNTMAIFSLKQLGWRDNIETYSKEDIVIKLPKGFNAN